MATVDVINIKGDKVSQADLPDEIFNVPVNVPVLHQVVKAQLAVGELSLWKSCQASERSRMAVSEKLSKVELGR